MPGPRGAPPERGDSSPGPEPPLGVGVGWTGPVGGASGESWPGCAGGLAPWAPGVGLGPAGLSGSGASPARNPARAAASADGAASDGSGAGAARAPGAGAAAVGPAPISWELSAPWLPPDDVRPSP